MKKTVGTKKVFKKSYAEQLKGHKKAEKQHSKVTGEYVGEIVYGALDGIVTTFAIVAGSAGASLSPGIIIVLGFANLVADGLSMSVGRYLSLKSEQSYYEAQKKEEENEIEEFPDVEKDEIRQIYKTQGFSGKKLETLVSLITSQKTAWVNTMMFGELGLVLNKKDAVKAGLLTYAAFVIAGFVPLLSFVLSYFFPINEKILFPTAFLLTFATMFIVGSLRSLVIAKNWFLAGLEMLLIGGLTAIASYLVGLFLGSIIL
jgi:VIT1/CCC1 family predicted Fe2+/Mn2+ transporter